MEPHIYVENRAQAAIFEMEMKGQLSDGRWENSKPNNHWTTPCNAEAVVRPEKVGRDFCHTRGYNFGEKGLFEIVGERMTRFAQAAIAFPEVSIRTLSEYRWDFDDRLDAPISSRYSAEYAVKKGERRWRLLELVGVEDGEAFEAKLAATGYTAKDCKKDASRLTTCFRTKIEG
jgi:hypothetical protein